jgi:hypothetical protein
LREADPEAFQEIISKPLLNTDFKSKPDPEDPAKSHKIFQVNPTFGRLGFTSYTDDPGDTDVIIKSILANNQCSFRDDPQAYEGIRCTQSSANLCRERAGAPRNKFLGRQADLRDSREAGDFRQANPSAMPRWNSCGDC